jgi:hypothetical protein
MRLSIKHLVASECIDILHKFLVSLVNSRLFLKLPSPKFDTKHIHCELGFRFPNYFGPVSIEELKNMRENLVSKYVLDPILLTIIFSDLLVHFVVTLLSFLSYYIPSMQ